MKITYISLLLLILTSCSGGYYSHIPRTTTTVKHSIKQPIKGLKDTVHYQLIPATVSDSIENLGPKAMVLNELPLVIKDSIIQNTPENSSKLILTERNDSDSLKTIKELEIKVIMGLGTIYALLSNTFLQFATYSNASYFMAVVGGTAVLVGYLSGSLLEFYFSKATKTKTLFEKPFKGWGKVAAYLTIAINLAGMLPFNLLLIEQVPTLLGIIGGMLLISWLSWLMGGLSTTLILIRELRRKE